MGLQSSIRTAIWSKRFLRAFRSIVTKTLCSSIPQTKNFRLDTFLRPKPIRYMVGQKENRLDFASIMDSRKIFLAKLSQGLIGHENSQLLGALFVSKFHQLVMGRQETRESDRQYFWLYID